MYIKLTLPLFVVIPRKTKRDKIWWLNLNNYRNAHRMVLYNVKKIFTNVFLQNKKQSICILPPYKFCYTLYTGSRRRFDLMNPCCIVDKFGCDALIEAGLIPEDYATVIREFSFKYGGIDKEKPRVELSIEHIERS